MNRKKWVRPVLGLLALGLVTAMLLMIFYPGQSKEESITVGFVFSGSIDEEGWNGQHYQGIFSACRELQMELLIKENIKENSGQCERAIRELAEEGVEIIILSSYGYAAEVAEVIKEYPEIIFYSESLEYEAENINCYFARVYEARYLAGIIAGMQTETGTIGYVAAMPNDEVNRGINAFALGVQSVNPEARVVVAWTDSWDDGERERQLAASLVEEEGADVLTYHQNQTNVAEVAEEKGVYAIGYHTEPEEAGDLFLTSVIIHWDVVYKELLSDYARGKSDTVIRYWFGIEKNAVGLSELSPLVLEETMDLLDAATQDMRSGFPVFSGNLYDTEGKQRCIEGESISDDRLINEMDWFVRGVEFYEE